MKLKSLKLKTQNSETQNLKVKVKLKTQNSETQNMKVKTLKLETLKLKTQSEPQNSKL